MGQQTNQIAREKKKGNGTYFTVGIFFLLKTSGNWRRGMPLKRAVKGVGSRYTEEKKKSSAYTCNTYLSASMCTLCYPIDFGAVCVCTQGMFVCLLWCGPKLNNSTRREIWTVQSKIYICTLLRVFGRMVGRSWSHWRRLAGFFFLYPTAPAVPLTRETTDMTSHMFVWRNNEWHFFFSCLLLVG